MSKILFLVNHDVVIYNFRLELVERLLRDGHQVVISSPYGERIDNLVSLGCEFREITLSRHGTNPIQELRLISDYKQLLKDVRPDIVFSYTIKPNIYGGMACQSLGIPYVANITGLGTAVENGGIMQTVTVTLYKLAFRKVQRVFLQNQENMDFFQSRNIATSKQALLPGSGVNLERFSPLDYPSQENGVEFVFLSRIMKEKGIDQYLAAAKYIKGKYPNTVFHICGFCEEAYEQQLEELTRQGIICYHGMVRDIRGVLEHVHCTIHPTYYPEGISNVLLESSASGRPIITTDRAGCRETVEDGKTGYMIPVKDENALIEAIEKFLNLSWEDKRAMGLAGRAKMEREFNRQIVVEKYVEELASVSGV